MRRYLMASRGFTIVELLIVIVVIAILALISIAAYNGVQQRARDTRRVSDMSVIVKALEMYKVQTGSYPVASTTNTILGWETSSINPSQFISDLKTTGTVTSIPVDPVNTSAMSYRYYRYGAGSNGCNASRGAYYVLVVTKTETAPGQLDSSPGFSCARNWSTDGGWVTGAYTN